MKTAIQFVFILLSYLCCSAAGTNRPNILLIMSDDMGFSDIGCYGSEIATPNLDSLAQNGLRFTQFYNTARCCPTRASLLTGLYPHQAGVGHMMDDRGAAGYQGKLNRQCVTIAEALRAHGVKSALLFQLNATLASLQSNNLAAACGSLKSFIDLIEAQRNKTISSSDADLLIAAAIQIRAVIGCTP